MFRTLIFDHLLCLIMLELDHSENQTFIDRYSLVKVLTAFSNIKIKQLFLLMQLGLQDYKL